MTLASKITIGRLCLAPVFAALAVAYGASVKENSPDELLRWLAIAIFVIASASDGLDGYIARHYNQRSKFGAFIDPFADKTLLLTGIVFLTWVPWGEDGWQIPLWFTAIMIGRDIIIIAGIMILRYSLGNIHYQPHWTGKVCTFSQMVLLGWVMLKIIPLSPIYPTAVATLFTLWSGTVYFLQGLKMLKNQKKESD